jgi:hypothetical protein
MPTSPYDFEHFPRRLLQFKYDRRQLFVNMKIELDVAEGEQKGGKGYKLSVLGVLPDSQLESIIPVIVPACEIFLEDNFVWGKRPGSPYRQKLFPQENTTLYVFNWINGRTSLAHIAHYLQKNLGREPAWSFAFTRGLFLHLVQLQVCVPQLEAQIR